VSLVCLLPVDLGEEVYDLSQEKNAWLISKKRTEDAVAAL
jgi:hypothetical protein